jgi:hypothetical protein
MVVAVAEEVAISRRLHDFADAPDVVANPGGHRRSHAKRLVDVFGADTLFFLADETPNLIGLYVAHLDVDNLPRHDPFKLLASARLCREAGGELDQIQFLLGHVSVQTTEKYLGTSSGSRERQDRY